jgi:hypothetical protein
LEKVFLRLPMNGKFEMRRRLTKLISPGATERKSVEESGEKIIAQRVSATMESPTRDVTGERIEAVFDSLSGQKGSETLGGTGLVALVHGLGMSETDIGMLIFLYRCECASLIDITRQEFIRGMKTFSVLDLMALKKKLPLVSEEIIGDPKEFANFFKYVFQACREGTIKTIPKESALFLLPICLSESGPKYRRYLGFFLEFLEGQEGIKNIKSDEWMSFLNFSLQVEQIEDYDASGHWPLIIDSFVEWKEGK